MEIIDIITAEAKRSGVMPGALVTGISIAVAKRKAKIFHDDKTIAIVEPIEGSPGDFEIHLATADAAIGLMKSAKALFQQISETPNIHRLYSTFKDKKIQRLLEMIGVDLQKSDKKKYTWMTEV